MPAPDAQTRSATSAYGRTSTSRAAYGAPEAPVMPRKTRTGRLFRALRLAQEDTQLVQLRLPERRELRHHVVARLGRVGDVVREEVGPLPALADRREVGGAEVRAARAEIGVTGGAPGGRENRRAGDRLLVVCEPLSLRRRGHGLNELTRQRPLHRLGLQTHHSSR